MKRKQQSESLIEDRKLLNDISEMTSVIIEHYSLIKLTATELVLMTENVQYKSQQLQKLLKMSEEQLGMRYYQGV